MLLSFICIANSTQLHTTRINYTGYKDYNHMTNAQKSAEFCSGLMYCFRTNNGHTQFHDNYHKYKEIMEDPTINHKHPDSKLNFLILVAVMRDCIVQVNTTNNISKGVIVNLIISSNERLAAFFTDAIEQIMKMPRIHVEIRNLFDDLYLLSKSGQYEKVANVTRKLCILIENNTREMLDDRLFIYDLYCTKSDWMQLNHKVSKDIPNENVDSCNFLDSEHKIIKHLYNYDTYICLSVNRYCIDLFTIIKSKFDAIKKTNKLFSNEQARSVLYNAYLNYLRNIEKFEEKIRKESKNKCQVLPSVLSYINLSKENIQKLLIHDSFYFHVTQYMLGDNDFERMGEEYSNFILSEAIRVFSHSLRCEKRHEYFKTLMPVVYVKNKSHVHCLQMNRIMIF